MTYGLYNCDLVLENKMDIEAFLLCDAATDTHGKLNVIGAFDNIFAKQLPAKHPTCAIAARIRFTKSEQGEHKIKINVVNQDGEKIVPTLDGKIAVRISDQTDSAAVNIVLNLHQMQFKNTGRYSIDLSMDDKHLASLPLNVRQHTEKSWQTQNLHLQYLKIFRKLLLFWK